MIYFLKQNSTAIPADFVRSQSTFSLVRQTLRFSNCNVLRTIGCPLSGVFSMFVSHKLPDCGCCCCCGVDVGRFSSAPTSAFINDGLYNSQYDKFQQICGKKTCKNVNHNSFQPKSSGTVLLLYAVIR